VRSICNIGGAARWAILATFVATLVMSIPRAVAVGVRSIGKLDLEEGVHLVPAGSILGASTAQAWTLASAWLGSTHAGATGTQKA
jgi:hypothetical protein